MPDLESAFRTYVEAQAARILTQMDRDPDSPTYGCFDRNYWHYKMRDFPSAILQQAVHALVSGGREEWAVAAINALARQVRRNGAVDEYFPGEDSYPAAAFGLWAAARVLYDWRTEEARLLVRIEWEGLRRLARRLSRRVELEAANQYAAGVAALALASRLEGFADVGASVAWHAERLFALQHPEGWFAEYGGPDFGYLTVTIDALADYEEATGDARAGEASARAIEFLARLMGPDGQLPWTLNSRNTDYVTPYGLVRAAARNPVAAWLVESLFGGLGSAGHALWATDDRYHLHYIYASVVRSQPHLCRMVPAEAPSQPRRLWLPGSGYFVARSEDGRHALYLAGRKGGSLRLHSAARTPARFDHGWRVRRGGRLWVTDWWSDHWRLRPSEDGLVVEGAMENCRFYRGTPLRHMVLRALGWLFGRRLTPLLRRMLIFRRGRANGPWFRRELRVDETGFTVRDAIEAPQEARARPAPRQNLRHVASAGLFHPEELVSPPAGGRREYAIRWRDLE